MANVNNPNCESCMPDRKVVFVAFAIEDQRQRDLLKGQSLNTASPFEYTDMSVKEAYDSGWKDKVRTRIRRSDGVIALVSKSTPASSGEIWEVQCAQAEEKPLLGIWAYTDDRTKPTAMSSVPIVAWEWNSIARFIDRL